MVRRKWLSERSYADLVALCQFLAGPASSQAGIALGLCRSGYSGALAAWMGFTLPSAIVLTLFALSISSHGDVMPPGALHGLKVVAVALTARCSGVCPHGWWYWALAAWAGCLALYRDAGLAFSCHRSQPHRPENSEVASGGLVFTFTAALFERLQCRHVENFHQSAMQVEDTQCAQAGDGSAHGFQAQPQVRGHVFA